MNYGNKAKNIYIDGIRNNKFIPDEYKIELINMIATHFMLMSQFIGTFELLVHREKEHHKTTT